MSRSCFVEKFLVWTFVTWAALPTGHADEIQFNRDIRPILSEYCFACHGFDAKKREANLRLDVPDDVFAARDGKTILAPGNLAQSELWRRITSTDADQVMPPPAVKHPLSADQLTVLKQWIEQGAKYQKHWAFETPVKPEVPGVKDASWPRTPIDRFLLSRLEHEGLSPRKEAAKSVLVRRVAFALTGLPPTREEVALFEADPSPQAYEHLVDRYLKSPRFGEEMARHWLDVARYADTHGLHLDNERTMWAYRDWVIGAFNDNLPFDQFTVEQLAGDLLPNPTREQLIATGFNRCNVTTGEGGTIPEEFLYRYAVERASTTMETWLGLTGGCAVCHDHKYDPITSRDFYSLYAFFYSAADPALDRNVRDTEPFLSIPTRDQKSALEQAKLHEDATRQQLDRFAGTLADVEPSEGAEKVRVEDLWLDDVFPPHARTSCSSRNASVWKSGAVLEPPLGRRALFQASASKYQDKFENPGVPLIIPESAVIEVWVKADRHEPPQALMLEFSDGQATRRALWGDAELLAGGEIGTPDRLRLGDIPQLGVWTMLKIPAERLSLQPGSEIRSVTLNQFGGVVDWDGLRVVGEIPPSSDPRASFSAWWKSRTGKDTPGVPGELAAALKDGPEKDPAPAAELVEKLRRHFVANVMRPTDPEHVRLQRAWQDAQSARLVAEDAIPGTFVFKDLDKPRDAFVMLRGQYDKPGDKVEPAVPAIFTPIKLASPEARPTRLDLARWLVAADHPLTARVAVNRFWQQFFGTGLVKTSFDFGSQGDPPSHPELLDWLAVTFQER
ncbi:MAG: PSD1 and planctomycete cytochrome C domain-containing protein, partial [Planctomycetaceae bacterium]